MIMLARRFGAITVPLYIVLLLFTLILAGGVLFAKFYRETIANYEVYISEAGQAPAGFSYGSWPALENSDFFASVRGSFVKEQASFIEADLVEKRLTVYTDGVPALTVPILAIGKTGSWWETPAGLYKIDTKEENHYSGFSGVNMPWSLPFQGNFFIHGWPSYPDGTPVASTYSGGCIRLGTDDARQVYDLATVGMPVLVFRGETATDTTRYSVRPPAVSARQYLVADLASNFVLLEQGAGEVAPIASIAKLVTALVATEYINLDREIVITKPMLIPTSKPRLWVGQRVRAFDLLYPLLLESSNEAAEAFAEIVGSGRFVNLMNAKAKALGLQHTHFADAAGRLADNVSTPEDLFQLLKYLRGNQSFFLNVSAGKANRELGASPVFSGLENLNGFWADPSFVGGKIGKSEAADETMASVFLIDTVLGKRAIAVIVLGSQSAITDVASIVDYVKATYVPTAN